MPSAQVTGFSTLPTEMVENIFECIHDKEDIKAVALVNRAWHNIMATMMWRSLGPDLDASSDKSLATLLHPQNRILPHIRDLYCIGADEQIRLLLLALPRDNLTEFQADSSVSPLTIQMLLQSQRKLQHLNVFVINDPALLDDGHVPFCDSQTWIKPLVKEVKTLKTYLPTSPGKTADSFRYYQFLLENIPSLKELCIDGYTEPNVPPTWIDLRIIMQEGLTTARFPQLTSLRLKLVDLGKSSQVLFSNFKFSGLAKLCLIGCDHMATFMDALLEYYNKNSEVLEELCISLPWHSSEPGADTHAIERFLKDGPKVQDLELDVSHHTLLDKACFIAQASSLKSLVLSTGRARQAKTYGVEEMKAILDACQKLKYLAVNLPEVRLGPIMDLADTFRLGKHRGDLTHVDTEFEAMLELLAQHQPLHTLRMLNLPALEWITIPAPTLHNLVPISEQETKLCRVIYQRFANEMMRFMDKVGSAPTVFSTQLAVRVDRVETWPMYTFTKGRTVDARGMKEVVAVPLKEPLREMPSSLALFYTAEDV